MCSKEEIQEIVHNIVNRAEIKNNERYEKFNDKLENTLIAVRDSIPPSFSHFFLQLDKKVDAINENLSHHEKRIRKSENTLTYITGVVIGIGSVAGIVWAVASDFIKNKLFPS